MKTAITVAAIGAIAGLASGQTVISFNNAEVDGAAPNTFTINQTDHGALTGISWDLSYDSFGISWGSEINITLLHVASGFTFSFDGSDANFADLGPNDVLFGWGDTGGVFASAGAVAASGPADTFGAWQITLSDEFDDGGVDGLLSGTITINKIPAPSALALLGMGGLAQLSGIASGTDARARCLTPFPQPPAAFTEEAAIRGLDFIVAQSSTPNAGYGGASFIDLDGDGDPDIVTTGRSGGLLGIYENDGTGHFIDRSATATTTLMPKGGGVVGADYDADGDMDLFITQVLADDVLLRNDGNFVFTDVTAAAGVAGELGAGVGATWGDYDGDGWLDLYVSNRTGSRFPDFSESEIQNRLYRNQGDGTFVDMAPALGVDCFDEPTLTAAFVDFDLDGDADLYIGNDKGTSCIDYTNKLFENVGGSFVDITVASNSESCTDTMGIGIGDFDGNGWPDFYCTNTPPAPGHALMLNNGDKTFDWVAAAAGVTGNQLGWGCLFFDHDNDGDLALYVTHSNNAANHMYDWSETWPVPEIGAQMGVDTVTRSYNVSTADIDGDGDLDLLVQDLLGPLLLYVNNEGSRRHWARFRVVGENPNQHAIGAIVRCYVDDDMQISEVLAGGNNYRTQNELVQHFGLDGACMVDSVGVQWADGQQRTLTSYPADQTWTLFPPSMLGDSDFDGRVSRRDMVALLAALGPTGMLSIQYTTSLLSITAICCSASAQLHTTVAGQPGKVAGVRCPIVIAGDQRPFTQEAAERGVIYPVGFSSGFSIGLGSGAFVDVDADGDPDIVAIGREDGLIGFFENDGTGHFTDRSAASGAPLLPEAGAICAADYDADGDLDLFINNVNIDDTLLRNEGGFFFTDVTAQAGVGGGLGSGGGSTWGDINGDGWLDLYVSNRTGTPFYDSPLEYTDVRNRLYLNLGDGTFVDVAPNLGVDEDAFTLTSAFFDYDRDGDADLYVGNDISALCKQWSNTLYENVGGAFVDVTAFSGTESCTDTMGIGIGDFDGNLYPDLYCTNTPQAPGNTLMLNNADGTFSSVSVAAGTDSFALGWGCLFFDHDNDTRQALFVCNRGAPNRLYDYREPWPCEDIARPMKLDHVGSTYNVSTADIDADGDLDLLVQDISDDLRLYINHEGERRPWIRLRVVGEAPNRHAVGALLRVETPAKAQISEVLIGGNNYRSQNELVQHFGLGEFCRTTEIHVQWPDAQERTLTGYKGYATWSVFPPSMLGDSNFDGEYTQTDINAMLASFGPVRPGSEIHDIDGDGHIGAGDWRLLMARVGIDR
eukprot:g5486.t1